MPLEAQSTRSLLEGIINGQRTTGHWGKPFPSAGMKSANDDHAKLAICYFPKMRGN